MIKDPKNVNFTTSGRQPSEEDFARISDWIRIDKAKRARSSRRITKRKTHSAQQEQTISGGQQK